MVEVARIARATDVVAMKEVPTSPPPPPTPPEVTMWKVKFRGNGDIDLRYTKVFRHTLAPQQSIEDVAKEVVLGTFPAPDQWKTPRNRPDGRSRLSIESKEHRYQLFVLEPGNFHFSVDHVAFSIAKDRENLYLEPRTAWEEPAGEVKPQRIAPLGVEPRVAYFTARAHLDTDIIAGEPAAFNFHIDLTFPDGTRVPISIDPDVGHPGGYDYPDP